MRLTEGDNALPRRLLGLTNNKGKHPMTKNRFSPILKLPEKTAEGLGVECLMQISVPRAVMHLTGLQNKAASSSFAFKKKCPKTVETI